MAVLAAMREGKSRRIGKAAGRAMHHLGNQRQRLQGSWPQAFDQEQRCKIP
jgi:hypothetical protein